MFQCFLRDKKMSEILAKNIRKLMSKHKISTSQLARKTGVNQPVIHRIMSGETVNPKIASLMPIAQFFGLKVDQLLSEKPLAPLPVYSTVPVLEKDQVFPFLADNFIPERTIVSDTALSPYAFSLVQEDIAMTPTFPIKSALIFDPQLSGPCYPFALIQHKEHILFRKVMQSQGMTIINTIHPHFPPLQLDDNHCIIARLAQARLCYLTHNASEEISELTQSFNSHYKQDHSLEEHS